MKKTLLIGLALGLVSVTTFSFADDQRPNRAKGIGVDISAKQGCVGGGWDCKGQKNWGGEGIIGSSHDMTDILGDTGVLHTSTGGADSYATRGAAQTQLNTGGTATGDDAQKRICVYCHHPHNSVVADYTGTADVTDPNYSPLWNRRYSASRAGGFKGYNNGLMMASSATASSDKRHVLNAAEEGGGTKIAGVSLLCMSCHDGVTAMNAYSQRNTDGPQAGGKSGSTTNGTTAGNNAIVAGASAFASTTTMDMTNHHPMGFNYRAVQKVDAEIAPVSVIMVPATNVQIAGLLYGPGDNATMECVTCHDVHNTANQPGAERFLWRSDNNSNFCLTCHLK